jgi:mannose-6-phosphate isomerase-like protein (cupin superfamily)
MIEHPDIARVLVTKNKADGSSYFEERLVKAETEYDGDGKPLFMGSTLWGTPPGLPAVGPGYAPEPVTDPFYPELGGVRFVFFTFLPQSVGEGDVSKYGVTDGEKTTAQDSAFRGLEDAFSAERPGMHITDSIDFVTVLAGEMYMAMDHGETLIKAGDTVIMNGAWHAWRNVSDKPCTVVSTLVGHPRKTG